MPVPCLSTTFFVHHFLFLYIFIIFVSVWWFFRSDQDADILFVFAIWHQPTTDICNYVQPHSPTNILRLSLIGPPPPQRVGRFGWYVYVILLCYLMNLFFCPSGEKFSTRTCPLSPLWDLFALKGSVTGAVPSCFYIILTFQLIVLTSTSKPTWTTTTMLSNCGTRGSWWSIQAMVRDFCIVNSTDTQFVPEMNIDGWMGSHNVVGLLNTEDHHVCPG